MVPPMSESDRIRREVTRIMTIAGKRGATPDEMRTLAEYAVSFSKFKRLVNCTRGNKCNTPLNEPDLEEFFNSVKGTKRRR